MEAPTEQEINWCEEGDIQCYSAKRCEARVGGRQLRSDFQVQGYPDDLGDDFEGCAMKHIRESAMTRRSGRRMKTPAVVVTDYGSLITDYSSFT
jgi:hypothetical protein